MGAKAVGGGLSPLSDLWAWPDPRLPHDVRDGAMAALCEAIAAQLPGSLRRRGRTSAGLRLHDAVMRLALDNFEAEMPPLARAVHLSPFDAAIHDAVGHALGISAFAFYNKARRRADCRRLVSGTGSDPRDPGGAAAPPVRLLAAWLIMRGRGGSRGRPRALGP